MPRVRMRSEVYGIVCLCVCACGLLTAVCSMINEMQASSSGGSRGRSQGATDPPFQSIAMWL